jgi:hypothetical protein
VNGRQRRVQRRRDALYAFFQQHIDEPFSLAEACAQIGCSAGATSKAAIPGLRSLAESDGWHFPPAVPAGGHRYVLTKNPAFLIDPAIHIGRTGLGIRARETKLVDGIRDGRDRLPPAERPVASALLAAADFQRKVMQDADEFLSTVTKELVSSRREQRGVDA